MQQPLSDIQEILRPAIGPPETDELPEELPQAVTIRFDIAGQPWTLEVPPVDSGMRRSYEFQVYMGASVGSPGDDVFTKTYHPDPAWRLMSYIINEIGQWYMHEAEDEPLRPVVQFEETPARIDEILEGDDRDVTETTIPILDEHHHILVESRRLSSSIGVALTHESGDNYEMEINGTVQESRQQILGKVLRTITTSMESLRENPESYMVY